MTTGRESRLDAARAALGAAFGACDPAPAVVELNVDGQRFVVSFEIDANEHCRRTDAGVGAATNTGLLHALWELPEGVAVRSSALMDEDLATLRDLGFGYVDGSDVLTRTYVPAGRITTVVVVADTETEGVARVSRLPPIFWRLAVALRAPTADMAALAAARRGGIGRVLRHYDGAEVLAPPQPPLVGVPAVYRWWLSELAYRNGGYGNCAHCSS